MKKINFVSAAFRNKEDTLNLIDSYTAVKNKLKNFELSFFLINDYPKENILSHKVDSIEEIKTPGDIWWTKSIQLGIDKSLETESDYTILTGTDLTFDSESLESLISILEKNRDIDVLHPKVRDIESGEELISGISLPNPFLYIPRHISSDINLRECDMLSARFVAIRTKILRSYRFDERLIQYASDYDFFLKLKRDGKILALTNKSIIFARMERTGISRYNIDSFREYFKSYRRINSRNYFPSIIYFYTKNFGNIYGWLNFFLKFLKDIMFIARNKVWKKQ